MTFDKKIVDDLLNAVFPLPEMFGKNWDTEEWNECYFEKLADIDPDVRIESGVSKIVIISSLLDVVIKIPFSGSFEIPFSENENEDEYDDFGEFVYFNGAETSKNDWDYCLAEYEKYEKLKELNLNCFLAETILYKTIDNFSILIQENVIPNCYLPTADTLTSLELKRTASKISNGLPLDFDWLGKCIEAYGEEKTKNFIDYCSNVDYDLITDMHGANYGYRPNKTPAILDFSGFHY